MTDRQKSFFKSRQVKFIRHILDQYLWRRQTDDFRIVKNGKIGEDGALKIIFSHHFLCICNALTPHSGIFLFAHHVVHGSALIVLMYGII